MKVYNEAPLRLIFHILIHILNFLLKNKIFQVQLFFILITLLSEFTFLNFVSKCGETGNCWIMLFVPVNFGWITQLLSWGKSWIGTEWRWVIYSSGTDRRGSRHRISYCLSNRLLPPAIINSNDTTAASIQGWLTDERRSASWFRSVLRTLLHSSQRFRQPHLPCFSESCSGSV